MPYAERPRRNGRAWHDGKAPDGFTINGWRRVAKGGYVRMMGGKHYHESLNDWVGQWVFAEIVDPWAVNVVVWPDRPWEDHKKRLFCINEMDWASENPAAASKESRERFARGKR